MTTEAKTGNLRGGREQLFEFLFAIIALFSIPMDVNGAAQTSTGFQAEPETATIPNEMEPANLEPASLKNARTQVVASAERGITGTYTFAFSDQTLRVRVQRDVDAPLIVRLRQADVGKYELLFIGTTEGRFDLRDTLQDGKGRTVDSLPPMYVSIVSTLPNDQRSDLYAAANFEPAITGGYKSAMLLGLASWMLVPAVVYVIKRLRRSEAILVSQAPPPPTFAEQLEPLVMAAANRSLSTREKGRLELLLLQYWRERVVMTELSMAAAIQQLRVHPEAGPLLNAVERWLHCEAPSRGNSEDRSPEEILRLLLPYRSAVAYESERLQASGGSP